MTFLAVVFLLAASGILQAAAPGVQAPRVSVPTLVQEDLVTSDASSVPQTNGWGAQGDRLVRAPDGVPHEFTGWSELFAVLATVLQGQAPRRARGGR